MRRFPGPPIIGLIVLSTTVVVPPLYGQQIPFDSKAMALRLAAIEQKNPYRLRELVGNGRPTLIAFIDHLCYTCLRSVKDVDQLKRDFSVRANIVVIDPSRITTAHSWAKDRYQVWFVPKFIILNNGGNVTSEYFGPISPRVLASDLQTLLAQ
jgi:hypothetical protein